MPLERKRYSRALTIAGSDSGGGAGIQADLKTFSALGVYGTSALTALTAQNTQGVRRIFEVAPDFVRAQIDAVLDDIGTDAVKVGMLQNARVIEAVADALDRHSVRNVVVDPVLFAKGGAPLLEPQAVEMLKQRLLPLALIITPNLPEASILAGRAIATRKEMEWAARELLQTGSKAVLVKGGHLSGPSSLDCLVFEGDERTVEVHWLEQERIKTLNCHGTGCTLSSAIAAHLAKGFPLFESVVRAKDYLTKSLQAGSDYSLGSGHGPVHHFHGYW